MIRPLDVIQAIRKRYIDMLSVLDERGRRLLVAAEARAYGLGGAYVVEQATGVARSTINRGIAELKANPPPTGRVRRVRIPTQSGHRFRFEAGHRSDLMSATIPK